jgi:hypothetical protein
MSFGNPIEPDPNDGWAMILVALLLIGIVASVLWVTVFAMLVQP